MENNSEKSYMTKPRLIRRKEVLSRVGLSQTCLYEQMAAGQFPKPINIGPKSVAWLEIEILEWIEQRVSLRGNGRKPTASDLRI